MTISTQTEQIAKHLKRGWKITPLQALQKYGCLRLAARVYDLKRKYGWEIHTDTSNGYAVYKLVRAS